MRSAGFRRTRRASAAAVVTALALTALASCGTSSSGDGNDDSGSGSSDPSAPLDPKTKVTLTIDCMPPTAKAAELREWNEDVKTFNKKYPNVRIEGKSTPGQCLEPPRFTAMLKGRSQPDVFYAYFTDLQQVLDNDGAVDISAYVDDTSVPALKDIQPQVLDVARKDGKLYALPTSNYTMGLMINRKLFTQAGLDPDTPPATWEEVRAASRKIAALGKGVATSASTAPTTTAAGTSPPPSTPWAGTSWTRAAGRPRSTTTRAGRSSSSCTTCAGRTTAWAGPSC